MNTERLHLIAATLNQEIGRLDLVGRLQRMVGAIRNQLNSPSEQTTNEISGQLDALRSVLAGSTLNDIPTTWHQQIAEMNLAILVGTSLSDEVENAIRSSQPLLTEAVARIEQIQSDVERAVSAFQEIVSGFGKLRISKGELAPGEVELSVLFPRELFGNRLDRLLKEGQLIDRFVSAASVLATGSAEHATIKEISTTDPVFILCATPPTLLLVSQAVNIVLNAYGKVQGLRKLRADAIVAEATAEVVEALAQQAKQRIHADIDAFGKSIKNDPPAKLTKPILNETVNNLLDAMVKLAARIDRGLRIEVAAKEGTQAGSDGDDEAKSAAASITEIRTIAAAMQQFPITGEPILGLPNPENDNDETDDSAEDPKR